MKDRDIHVALCFDLNYMNFMLTTALSVLDNIKSGRRLCFHLLHQNLSKSNLSFIFKMLSKYNNVQVFFYPESELNLPEISASRYGKAALYRMVLAQALPASINKVIYLDSDLLVFDDLSKLWGVSLDNNIAAAVVNLSSKPCKEVELEPENYFNSGVMVIDLKKWKESNISSLAVEAINEKQYRYLDQAVLNSILQNRWLKLPIKWNMESDIFAYGNSKKEHVYHKAESINSALKKPGIIHFTGPRKPWHYYSFHPYKYVYKEIVDKHFYKNSFLYKDKTLIQVVKMFFEFKRRSKQKLNSPKGLIYNRQ